jgi:hypothetical protein
MVKKDNVWMMSRGMTAIFLGQIAGFLGFRIADFYKIARAS